MHNNNLPTIKDAIRTALNKANTMTFGGFKYILLKNGEPKHLLKKQKAEYTKLKNLFYDSSKNTWEYPFRQYDISTAYIAQTLKTLKKQGEIQKKYKRYFLSDAYKNIGQHTHNKIILDKYPLELIYTPTDPLINNKNEPITIYGINEEIFSHAKQIQMDKKLEKKINKLLDIASQLNQLKYDIEEMYKIHLFIKKCQQYNDPKLNEIAIDQIYRFIFLLTVTPEVEKLSKKPYGHLQLKFDRKKTELEVEHIIQKLTQKNKSKKKQKKQQISTFVSKKQKENLVNILEDIYHETGHIYNQPDQTYLTSIVIDHAPTADKWNNLTYKIIKELKQKYKNK